MSALVTGGTGTIGTRLIARMGEPVLATSRAPDRAKRMHRSARLLGWDGRSPLDPTLLEGVDSVFHLAGEPVAEGRWSDEKKARIRDSRVIGTRSIVESLGQMTTPPRVLVSASAIGYYGSTGDQVISERSLAGDDFLASVCKEWEAEAKAAERYGIRVVTVRIGIVLAREGGALAKMMPLFRLGLGGRLGDGKQWMSWIHVDDVVGLCLHARDNPSLRGPVNAVAPNPVTNAEFTQALAHALGRPAWFTVPRPMLGLAMGEAAAMVTASQRIQPVAALASGYAFAFSEIEPAMRALCSQSELTQKVEARS